MLAGGSLRNTSPLLWVITVPQYRKKGTSDPIKEAIGNNCSIYHGVTLGGTTWSKGKRHPTLEDDVVIGAGAKILGPITIGEGSHIGSNSVVVKNVPAASTVVGIPGHIVTDKERKTKRDELAENVGFDAYAAADMPDPVSNAIDGVLDHLHGMQKKLDEMEKSLKKKNKSFRLYLSVP